MMRWLNVKERKMQRHHNEAFYLYVLQDDERKREREEKNTVRMTMSFIETYIYTAA